MKVFTKKQKKGLVNDMVNNKIMQRSCDVKISKKGQPYLVTKSKGGKTYFVNLVKNNKAYKLKIPQNVVSAEVSFTSFKFDFDKNILTLFNVTDVSFVKGAQL